MATSAQIRHGVSNLRIYGSITTGSDHAVRDLVLLVDLPEEQSVLRLLSGSQRGGDLQLLIRTQSPHALQKLSLATDSHRLPVQLGSRGCQGGEHGH